MYSVESLSVRQRREEKEYLSKFQMRREELPFIKCHREGDVKSATLIFQTRSGALMSINIKRLSENSK